jgi:hypothetical protein
VLLPPINDDETHLPEPLVVLQVALEGQISKETILEGLGRGMRAGGDMIPWLISQQFQENGFAKLSGARIVRIACHPDYANVGSSFPNPVSRRIDNLFGFRWDMARERFRHSIHSIAANTSTLTSRRNLSSIILT